MADALTQERNFKNSIIKNLSPNSNSKEAGVNSLIYFSRLMQESENSQKCTEFSYPIGGKKRQEFIYDPKKSTYSNWLKSIEKANLKWFAPDGFPIRNFNKINPLVNGEVAWKTIHKAIKQAKKSIHIAVWWFEPGMRLIREEGIKEGSQKPDDQIGELLELKGKENVKVKLLLWDNDIFKMSLRIIDLAVTEKRYQSFYDITWLLFAKFGFYKNIEVIEVPFHTYPSETELKNQERLKTLYQSLREKIAHPTALLAPHMTIESIPYKEWEKLIKEVSEVINLTFNTILNDIKNDPLITWENLFFSHHQKTVTIDKRYAFVMGMNMRRRDWDKSEHNVYEPTRDHDVPRHDISAQIMGPCVNDVEYNFIERWNTDTKSTKLELPKIDIAPRINLDYISSAQIVRTIYNKEESIFSMYLNAIANAEKYIYIENQYFRSKEIATAIIKRLKQNKRLKVLIAMEPDTGFFTKGHTSESFQILAQHFKQVPIYQLMVHKQKYPIWFRYLNISPYEYTNVNIHAKIMIIDDYFYTIGSANINKRSMSVDSEINVAVIDPEKAKNLRLELWSSHLNISKNKILDYKVGINIWEKSGVLNIIKINKLKMPLEGRVVPLKDPGGTIFIPPEYAFFPGESFDAINITV